MFKVDVTRPKDWKKKKRKSPVNEQIKHQIDLRKQYTRVAKRTTKYLTDMRDSVKELLDEAVESKDWKSANELSKTMGNIDRQVKDQYAVLGLSLTDDLSELAKYEVDYAAQAHGATFSSDDIDEKTIYSLVTNDPFDGKLMSEWLTEQQVGTQTRIKQSIRLGIINGLTNAEIIRAVTNDNENPFVGTGTFAKSKRQIEALVRTAAAHVTAQADMAAFEVAGIEKYRISSILDSRTTPICAAMDGKVFYVNDPDRKIPPFHANCRSTMIAIFDDDEPYIDQTFQEWLVDQDEDEQIKILGAERHKLWKSGISLDRFVDLDNVELIPLSELRKQLKTKP